MENASKALLIAGGILLAMLVMALLVLLNNNVQTLKTAQLEKAYQEELTAFNMQFEAYNKKIMYGTDVISVVNKAIANNNLMNVQMDPTNTYYVNIQFTINEDMVGTKETITEKIDGTGYKNDIDDTEKLSRGTYKLGRTASDGTFAMDDGVLNFFANEAKEDIDKQTDPDTGVITTTIIKPAIINFKRAIFTCIQVHYNENTRRVDSLTFKQVQKK